MNNYLVIKVVQQYCRIVVVSLGKTSHRKKLCVTGNLPELYKGLTISLELHGADETAVTDYRLNLTEKNLAVLTRNRVNTENYRNFLEHHMKLKEKGITWRTVATEISSLYEKMPFHDADRIHKEIVDDAKEETRLKAISKQILETARKRRKINYQIEEYLSYFDEVEQQGAYQQLMISLKMLCLQASSYGFKDGMVYDNELKQKEDFVRQNIVERIQSEYSLLTEPEIQEYVETIKDKGFEKEQIDVLWGLISSNPCIVTGGAGVGKTSVIKCLIDCYAMHYNRAGILLVAPTGKATRRLAEKTDMNASTIHKALRKNPENGFVYYHEKNPLPYSLIIVDESSMIDTSLMYDLLKAVRESSKIIFVGDCNQLYPVGYGEPFFDFMEMLDVFYLRINHRQSDDTDILNVANDALEGKCIESGRGVIVSDISYIQIGEILESIQEHDNLQILSPYNDLNLQINNYLKKGEEKLNVGDKIMTTRNTEDYCNGDIGTVLKSYRDGGILIQIDGRNILVRKNDIGDISLAYAVTIHKMQGSEADKIIVFLPRKAKNVDNKMLYTAFTRARKQLEIYYYG